MGRGGQWLTARAGGVDLSRPPLACHRPLRADVADLHLHHEPETVKSLGQVSGHVRWDHQIDRLSMDHGASRRQMVALGIQIQEVFDRAGGRGFKVLAQQ